MARVVSWLTRWEDEEVREVLGARIVYVVSQCRCWARTCLRTEKELLLPLLWQAYCGHVDFGSIYVLFREGKEGPAI